MTTIRFDRLQALAQFLKDLGNPESVDLGGWVHEGSCGTIACALGWACHMPEFKQEGLFLDNAGTPIYHPPAEEEGVADFEAGDKFFGVPPAYDLFGLRGCSAFDDEEDAEGLDDRDLALHRIRRVFEEHRRKLELA